MTRLLHNLTHRHTQATKPGVGTLLFCRHRITGAWEAQVAPADTDAPQWSPISREQIADVALCRTPGEVRAVLAGGAR